MEPRKRGQKTASMSMYVVGVASEFAVVNSDEILLRMLEQGKSATVYRAKDLNDAISYVEQQRDGKAKGKKSESKAADTKAEKKTSKAGVPLAQFVPSERAAYFDAGDVDCNSGYGFTLSGKTYSGHFDSYEVTPRLAKLKTVAMVLQRIEMEEESDITIYTKSKYVHGCTMKWAEKWKKNNWTTTRGTVVLDRPLIENIIAALDRTKCKVVLVAPQQYKLFADVTAAKIEGARMEV